MPFGRVGALPGDQRVENSAALPPHSSDRATPARGSAIVSRPSRRATPEAFVRRPRSLVPSAVAAPTRGSVPTVQRPKLPKPYVVVLIVGVLVAIGTIASGIAPRVTEWHDGSVDHREPFVNVPDPMYWAFYVVAATMLFVCAWLVSQRVRNYERGKPDDRRTTRKNLHQRIARLPRRRVDADAAPRSRRGRHALVHLLRLHLAVHRDGRARDRPPASRQPEVPPRRRLPGVRVRRRDRRHRLRRRHRVGDRPSLRPAPVPHPHQDEARGRGDPRHVPRDRPHRLHHRGAPHRCGRAARLREVVVRRVPASSSWFGGWTESNIEVVHRVVLGRALRRVHRVPRDPPDHEAAPHGHVADEHVPARQGPPEGRDEARCRT